MMPKSQNFGARVASQRCLVLGNGLLKYVSTATDMDMTVEQLLEAVFSNLCTSRLYKESQPGAEVKETGIQHVKWQLIGSPKPSDE
jgi:hypothetical protein